MSDLNTKIKDLENDKLSLLTTIKLFQIQEKSYEVACLSNKTADINVSSDSNYKDDVVQISLSSDEENFTGKASEHRKLNRKYTKSKKNRKTMNQINNSAETNYDDVHANSSHNCDVNEVRVDKSVTERNKTYAEVSAQPLPIDKDEVEVDKSATNHDETNVEVAAQRFPIGKNILRHNQVFTITNEGFKGVKPQQSKIKEFFLSGIAENVKESQIMSYFMSYFLCFKANAKEVFQPK